MLTSHAKRFLLTQSCGLLITVMIGWLSGYWLISLLVFAFGTAIWHIRHALTFDSWQQTTSKKSARAWQIPFTAGLWRHIYQRASFLQKRNKKRQAILRRTLLEFRSVTESFPEPAVIIDDQQQLQWLNGAAVDLLGLRRPDDIGQPVGNILRQPLFTQWLDTDTSKALDIENPKDTNGILSVRLFQLGKHRQLMHFRDVTQLRNVERVRQDFIANVSHELRTPLTVLIGYLETLLDTDNTESRLIGERMHDQTRHMRALIDDLIEISRLQAGSSHRKETPVNIVDMLALLKQQTESLNTKNHAIHFQVDTAVAINGVSQDLESAFRNLIINAIRYTPDNGEITVRYFVDGDNAVLSVSDNGIGIPSEDIPRLTERFYRVAKDRARTSGGSGLGLSIVKHVLNTHDARLEIHSELEQGSRFLCIFPADKLLPTDDGVDTYRMTG